MKNKLFGFTLSELLLALGVIGIVAAITIPPVSGNIQRKLLSSQIKNFVSDLKHLMDRQLATKNARVLADTDFGDLDRLFSDDNFPVILNCDTGAECWTNSYRRLSDMTDVTNDVIDGIDNNGRTVKLKSGAVLTFQYVEEDDFTSVDETDKYYGIFKVDINGNDGPNIVGRDIFWIPVTQKGKIYDIYTMTKTDKPEDPEVREACRDASIIPNCLTTLMTQNWNMDY